MSSPLQEGDAAHPQAAAKPLNGQRCDPEMGDPELQGTALSQELVNAQAQPLLPHAFRASPSRVPLSQVSIIHSLPLLWDAVLPWLGPVLFIAPHRYVCCSSGAARTEGAWLAIPSLSRWLIRQSDSTMQFSSPGIPPGSAVSCLP